MLKPQTEGALADIVRDTTTPLVVRGGGTRAAEVPCAGTVLDTTALSGITFYEPAALTIAARAGTALSTIQAALAAHNQRLPFEPPHMGGVLGRDGNTTIGGVVGANASGPRRIQAGACRDALIGVRFVDGRGAIVKNGGRVMKNVTGYDLVKLMAGSHGTLGVLSEVAFRVQAIPETEAVLRFEGLGLADAVAAMTVALGSAFQVGGAAHLPGSDGQASVTLLRVEGSAVSVQHRAKGLHALIAKRFGPPAKISRTACRDWVGVRDAMAFAQSGEDLWRVSVRPSDAVRAAGALATARLVLDWGGGLIWAGVAPGTDVRARLAGIGGHATLVRASPHTHARLGTFPPQAAAVAALNRGVRAQFDPRGIFASAPMAAAS